MTFLELLKQLEAHLGYHQMPLNPAATNLKNLFESSPLHHDFTKQLAQAIYSGNRCQRLSDVVDRDLTFEAVAPLRLEALRSDRTDIDLFRLLDELCTALDRIFPPVTPTDRTPELKSPSGEVIQMNRFRRRIKSSGMN